MKNKLILVAGHSATGKSTFARKLSKTLEIPCFSKNTLKEAMGDGFGQNSRVISALLKMNKLRNCLKSTILSVIRGL